MFVSNVHATMHTEVCLEENYYRMHLKKRYLWMVGEVSLIPSLVSSCDADKLRHKNTADKRQIKGQSNCHQFSSFFGIDFELCCIGARCLLWSCDKATC